MMYLFNQCAQLFRRFTAVAVQSGKPSADITIADMNAVPPANQVSPF
jgi:hypothetical protein